MNRAQEAKNHYEQSMLRVKNTPEPEGQKFHIGERVWISRELPKWMCHFEKGKWATIVHTYAHAYGGDNVKDYCIDIDGYGETSWYDEWLLSRDGSDADMPEDAKHYPEKCMLCISSKQFAKEVRDKFDKIILKALS